MHTQEFVWFDLYQYIGIPRDAIALPVKRRTGFNVSKRKAKRICNVVFEIFIHVSILCLQNSISAEDLYCTTPHTPKADREDMCPHKKQTIHNALKETRRSRTNPASSSNKMTQSKADPKSYENPKEKSRLISWTRSTW